MNFISFLQNPLVSLFLSMLGILVSLVIAYFQRKRMKLTFGIVSNIPIIDTKNAEISSSQRKDIETSFNKAQIDNLHVTVLKIRNVGNMAIEERDMQSLEFTAAEEVGILGVRVVDKNFDQPAPDVNSTHDKITIKPFRIDSGDWIKFSIFSKNQINELSSANKIKGKNITRDDEITSERTLKISENLRNSAQVVIFVICILLITLAFGNTSLNLFFLFVATVSVTIIYLLLLSKKLEQLSIFIINKLAKRKS